MNNVLAAIILCSSLSAHIRFISILSLNLPPLWSLSRRMPGPFERLFPPEQRRDNASHRPLLNSPLEPKHIRFGGTASGIPTLDDCESG